MKKIIATILTASTLFCSDIIWSKSYDEAITKAKKENKILMVLLTTKACPWCQKFKLETLKDQNITKKVNSKFIAVNLDRDRDKYPKGELSSKLVPTTYFINPKTLDNIPAVGYWSIEDFNQFLDESIKKYK